MKKIAYFVSGHGFGHAVRSALVVGELYKLGFECEIISSAPRFIFDVNLRGVEFKYRRTVSDVGVVQQDALKIDLPVTRKAWEKIMLHESKWIDMNLHFFESSGPVAVVADIVPSALTLAKRAGLPSFLVATFTWDWILDYYKDEDARFSEIAARLNERYMTAQRMIYTPLSFGLPQVEPKNKVSLIAKKSLAEKDELRKKLGIDNRPAFLVSFGGCGLDEIEKMKLEEMDDFQFLFLAQEKTRKNNKFFFTNDDVNHEDLVALSDAVITKPGYGVCAESILNRTPMIYTSRGKFAEYEPLVSEMQKYIPARYIGNEELLGGGLRPYLESVPQFTDAHLVNPCGDAADPGTGAMEAAAIIAGL
ncbi:MAG: hypothetical protein V3S46_08190 [Nitrospinota bacterium]